MLDPRARGRRGRRRRRGRSAARAGRVGCAGIIFGVGRQRQYGDQRAERKRDTLHNDSDLSSLSSSGSASSGIQTTGVSDESVDTTKTSPVFEPKSTDSIVAGGGFGCSSDSAPSASPRSGSVSSGSASSGSASSGAEALGGASWACSAEDGPAGATGAADQERTTSTEPAAMAALSETQVAIRGSND